MVVLLVASLLLLLLGLAGSSLKSKDVYKASGSNEMKESNMLITVSKAYSMASTVLPDKYKHYEDVVLSKLNWISQDNIRVVRYIDSGRFSTVFEGTMARNNSNNVTEEVPVILKILKPTYVSKIKREIMLLELLNKTEGVVQLLGYAKNVGCQTVTLIFEYFGSNSHWLSHNSPSGPLSKIEIKKYIYKLLKSLDGCHSKGVMHRDIKPRNVLFNREKSQIRILDFGLSDIYIPEKQYNPSVASRHYKAPELLFGYLFYDFGIDIWSTGCILAGLLFDLEPFFCGSDLLDQIDAVAAVVGSRQILTWATKYKLKLSSAIKKAVGNYPKVPFESYINSNNSHLCCNQSLDLVSKMLAVDHQDRITVRECLSHPYFDEVKSCDNIYTV